MTMKVRGLKTKNDRRRMALKLLAVVAPLIALSIVIPLAIHIAPMRFMDGEYAWYRQNKEYSDGHDGYCRVLIMGDSVAKAGWKPELLSADTYNFSIGGVSPVEEFYCLQEYLQNNEPPDTVIFTQGINHFVEAECFWSRGVYFGRLSAEDVLEAWSVQRALKECGEPLGENGPVKLLLYELHSPIYYATAFIKGLIASREPLNTERYENVIWNRGHTLFSSGGGTAIRADEIADYTSFDLNELLDCYFRKIISLCRDRDIRFIYQSAPVSEITRRELNGEMVRGYNEYFAQLHEEYPEAVLQGELIFYDDELFSDPAHLNEEGVERFSQQMREKYAYIFDEEKTS